MKVALQSVALLVVLGTFLPLIRKDTWVIRGWDFPRLQLFYLGVATLVALLLVGVEPVSRDLAAVSLLAVAIASLAAWMWRHTPLAPREVKGSERPGPTISLMVCNVLMSNRESDKLIALARSRMPDVIVALETDRWWADEIARLGDSYPHRVEIPQDDTYGMVLRSRLPLVAPKIEHLVRENIPSVHFGIELEGGELVHVHAIHPKPPFPDEADSSSGRDAELLLVAKRVKARGGASIVLGDMNDVAWSHTTRLFQKVSGLLDPRIGRGFFSTFHAGHWWMRWPLDHVFVSRHFRILELDVLESIGSDHFPMFAAFSYEPEGKAEQPKLDADPSERHEAARKIAKAE